MEGFRNIIVVSQILKGLLIINQGNTFVSGFTTENISFSSPKELEVEGNSSICLSLFLYQIMENAYIKNRPMQNSGTGSLQYPPLSLDLYYLITPYAMENQEGGSTKKLTIIGKAMQTFYDHAIVKGPSMLDALRAVEYEDYYKAIDQLCITLNPISLDDFTKIWNSLDTPMMLSVSYKVRVVMIESEREETVSRIITKSDDYYKVQGRDDK